jgi:hypothetical protein
MSNRRKHPRREIALTATAVCRATGRSYSCAVIDISHGGARFEFDDAGTIPDHFTVVMPGGVMRCCSAVRRKGRTLSARFIAADVLPELARV